MSNSIEQEPNRYLIAIGSPSAGNIEAPILENVENDIDRVVSLFTKPEQGYKRVLEDRIDLGAMASEIQDALISWFGSSERQSSDCVIVYYAGHGGEDGQFGSHYLYTSGSRPNSLQKTAIETSSLVKWFFEGYGNRPQNVLLILDVCYAGSGGKVLIENLTKASNTNLGKGFWVLGSTNANTEASDGGFVDALESVVNNRQWQDGEDFLSPIVVRNEINKYFESKSSPQRAVISILNNENSDTFIRNPCINSKYTESGGILSSNNESAIVMTRRKLDLFVNRKSTDRFTKDISKAIEEPETQPLMFYSHGIGGIGKSTLLHKIQEDLGDRVRFLKFSFGDPLISNSVDTPIKLMKYLCEQVGLENVSSNPFWCLCHRYEQTMRRLKTETVDHSSIASEVQFNLIKDYESDIDRSSSLISIDKPALWNSSNLLLNSISTKDRFEQLLDNHPATKDDLELHSLMLDPLSKIVNVFAQTLSKASQDLPIILVLDTYEKAHAIFDRFVGCHLLLNDLLGNSHVRIIMAGRFSLTNSQYQGIFKQGETLYREYPLEKFTQKETQSYLSKIGIGKSKNRHIWQRTKGYPYYLNLIRKQVVKNTRVNLEINTQDMVDLLLAGLNDTEKNIVQLAAHCRWFDRQIIDHLLSSFSQDIQSHNNLNIDWFRWLTERDFVIEEKRNYRIDDVARDIIRRHQCKDNEKRFRSIHETIVRYFDKCAEDEVEANLSISEKYTRADWRKFKTESLYHNLFADRYRGDNQFITCFFEGAYFDQPQIAAKVFHAIISEAEFESNNELLPLDTHKLLMNRHNVSLAVIFGSRVVLNPGHKIVFDLQEIVEKDSDSSKVDVTIHIEAGLKILFGEIDRLKGLARCVALIGRGFRNQSKKGINDIKQAEEEVNKIVESKDSEFTSNLFYKLGFAWGRFGFHKEALTNFDMAIKLNPYDSQYHKYKGVTLHRLGEDEQALISYEKAIEINPDDIEIHAFKGNLLYDMRRYQESIFSNNEVIKIQPDNSNAWSIKSLCLSLTKDHKEAMITINRAIDLADDDNKYMPIANKGIILARAEDYEKSIEYCEKSIKMNPDSEFGHYGKACCYALKGDERLAIESFEKAVNLEPSHCRSEAKNNPDFDKIRNDQRFIALMGENYIDPR
jgi:tetratricopeptide (TPR) repeat protein